MEGRQAVTKGHMSEKARVTETLVKYLAGLCDADGSLSILYKCDQNKLDTHYMSLTMSLASSDAVDLHGFIESLPDLMGMGGVYRYGAEAQYKNFKITKKSDLEMILPRIIKHMVIKGAHWSYLLEYWRENRGRAFTANEMEQVKLSSKASRVSNAGPLKPKNHPTWAWVAGYLDGDGWYSCNRVKCGTYKDKQYHMWAMRVGAVSHMNDAAVLYFLQNSFGGHVRDHGTPGCKVWERNIGMRDVSFAVPFLRKLVGHSHLKRHKIEKLLSIHQQRLTDRTPAGEVIV